MGRYLIGCPGYGLGGCVKGAVWYKARRFGAMRPKGHQFRSEINLNTHTALMQCFQGCRRIGFADPTQVRKANLQGNGDPETGLRP